MRCPKCNAEGCKYEESWKERIDKMSSEERKRAPVNWRTNFHAKCKLCGWEGII